MATELRLRRGTTDEHGNFIGAEAEATVDTDKNTIVVHDGQTQGGFPLAKEAEADAAPAVDSVATLRASSFPANLERLWLSGYSSEGDGGEGYLYRDGSGFTASDDNNVTEYVDDNGDKWDRNLPLNTLSADFSGGNIQDVIDTLDADFNPSGQGISQILVPARDSAYDGALSFPSTVNAFRFFGQGTNTRITATGAHAMLVESEGMRISDLWIDNLDTGGGQWDAISVPVGVTEIRFSHVDVDYADRYGIYLGGNRCHINNTDIQAGESVGLRIEGNFNVVTGLECVNVPGSSVTIGNTAQWNSLTAMVLRNSGGGYGLRVSGSYNSAQAVCENNADVGCRVDGNNNTVYVVAEGNGGKGVLVSGKRNTIFVSAVNNTGTDLEFDPNSSDNVVIGYYGTFNDFGTNNSTYN